ncbi:immunity protein YezG family protein [Pedobacter caeni]|uniref:DUF600 family protein n=1 Tax=Pedobacter caeni TaxID=288992 RepID=A0A1M4VEQ4_9SPHI|nr:immunity protein YezG family protein [Pedobacter caeni]SHE67415.1 Protein of unknown function, DUF600 [Pedobacter caeni]
MLERSNELITQIAQSAFNAIPVDSWNYFTVEVRILNKFIQLDASYVDSDHKLQSFDPEQEGGPDLSLLFKELREITYSMSPNQGAWYHAALQVDSEGEFNIQYEYETKPDFTYEPDNSKYIDDLKKFPREESLVPQWLKDIVNKG